jgi:hypothetical protein
MTLPSYPRGLCAAFELKLADGAEAVVPLVATFWIKLDANARQIFVKFEMPVFD